MDIFEFGFIILLGMLMVHFSILFYKSWKFRGNIDYFSTDIFG